MTLLRGAIREEARATLSDLSARYLRLRPSDVRGVALADGLAGIALVHANLDRVFPERGHRARAEHALGLAIDRLARARCGPGLLTGIAGVGWVVAHLTGDAGPDADDPCEAFDGVLAEHLERESWSDRFDLMSGLVGLGVYALERANTALLTKVIAHLAATARRRRPGAAWYSIEEWGTRSPEWDLGVAHGIPAVIALLGHATIADVDVPTRKLARDLLGRAVDWLLAQELPRDAPSRFPAGLGRGHTGAPTRLAWCYGDPGVAATLLVAARATGEVDWERAAKRIGLHAAARSEASAGVLGPGLCHGTAGVAHTFHRFYLATGEERFASAARLWFRRTLAMREGSKGFAGFRARKVRAGGPGRWSHAPGWLTGAAGIALALVAATEQNAPTWDRLLLLS